MILQALWPVVDEQYDIKEVGAALDKLNVCDSAADDA